MMGWLERLRARRSDGVEAVPVRLEPRWPVPVRIESRLERPSDGQASVSEGDRALMQMVFGAVEEAGLGYCATARVALLVYRGLLAAGGGAASADELRELRARLACVEDDRARLVAECEGERAMRARLRSVVDDLQSRIEGGLDAALSDLSARARDPEMLSLPIPARARDLLRDLGAFGVRSGAVEGSD